MKKKDEKRDIFGELMEGVESMRHHREGKATLRSHKPEPIHLPAVGAKLIRDTRQKLGMSQGLFAEVLRVNPRTLANWEQGRSKPNEQAATLILLVRNFPDTLMRLRKLAA
jgi:putative transcriptional regulator